MEQERELTLDDLGQQDIRPATGAERITAIKAIVDNQQFAVIDGAAIDLYSASLIAQIYDNLNPENQIKYSGFTAPKMGEIAFKLISK